MLILYCDVVTNLQGGQGFGVFTKFLMAELMSAGHCQFPGCHCPLPVIAEAVSLVSAGRKHVVDWFTENVVRWRHPGIMVRGVLECE